jgi:hypothetical protein
MAKTHISGFGKGSLRIAFGLMGSTPNNCLGVISGIPPLAERFPYLNFRYLVAAFYRYKVTVEGDAWSARSAEHRFLHQKIF